MAFKLTKDEIRRRDEINEKLQEAWSKIEEAVNAFNAKLEELKAPVTAAVETFNEVATAAKEFADDINNRADEEFGNKSEKWQEGEKGQEASDWKTEYENFEIPELEPELPEDLDIPQPEMDLTELLPEMAG